MNDPTAASYGVSEAKTVLFIGI